MSINPTTGLYTATETVGTTKTVFATFGILIASASATIIAGVQTLTSIVVTPVNVNVVTGTTRQYTAVAKDQSNVDMSPQPTFVWTTNNGTVTSTGLLTAGIVATGRTITATVSGVFGTTTFNSTVASPVLTTITVAPINPVVEINGFTKQFSAQGFDQSGAPMSPQPTFVWTVATGGGTINSTGLLTTGTVENSYLVTATVGSVSGTTNVIESAPVTVNIPADSFNFGTSQETNPAYSTWAAARAGCATITPIYLVVGLDGTGVGGYPINEAFVQFSVNTVISSSAVIKSVIPMFARDSAGYYANSNTQVVEMRKYDYGSSLTVSDFVIGDNLVNNSMFATYSASLGFSTTVRSNFTAESNATTLIERSIPSRFLLHYSSLRSVTAPGTLDNFPMVTPGAASLFPQLQIVYLPNSGSATGTLASIVVTPTPVNLTSNTTQQFVATGYDSNGNIVTITPTWTVPS